MAIQGLVSPEVAPQPKPVDVNDATDVTVEALSILGLVGDLDELYESVASDYTALTELVTGANETGELHVDVPYRTFPTKKMVEAIDSNSFGNYPPTYVYHTLWTPGGTEADSFTDQQLAKTSGVSPTARLALHTDESSEEPLLQFLNLPFDDYAKQKYNPDANTTQLDAIAEKKDALESIYPVEITPLSHRAFLMIALMRRIKGEKMPFSWGFMRDANLPRTEEAFYGRSVVGYVYSNNGSLGLRGCLGNAHSCRGVGLSVGQKAA